MAGWDAGYLEFVEAEELELQTRRRQPLNTYPISVQIKMAMLGDHICVLEAYTVVTDLFLQR